MNMKTTPLFALLLTLGSGCGRIDYGQGCDKPSELTSPWTELNLPIDEKQTRVCASSGDELKLRSYAWKSEAEAQQALATAVEAAGYKKDKCSQQACYYDKDGYQISIQPMDFKVRKKTMQNIVLRRRTDLTQKKS